MKLQRSRNGKRREISLEISICDVRGSVKKIYNGRISFNAQHFECSHFKLILNKEVLKTYLKNDLLIIKCRIFQYTIPEILTTKKYYARTIIGAEGILYLCTVEGFEEIENDSRIEKSAMILSEYPFFTMDLSTTEETYTENKILIKIKPLKPIILYSTCEISLVDSGGKIVHSVQDECNFEPYNLEQLWTFPFIQLSKVLGNKKLYLPNGVLHLSCEFVVSSGVKYNEVERIEYGIGNHSLLQCSGQTSDSDLTGSLKDNLQRFYEAEKFSDLTIRTPNKEFRVHKPILCARSEVFSAMFERDMKENQTGVVEIEDIDEDTVSKMLLFMYTDTVGEDLDFGMASNLYFAADKYEIVALKKKCSDFLKGNFTVTNVCDILVLADMHQDQELKSAAQEFVFEHSGEIMKSEEWTKLMQNNIQLASVTMRLFIQNLKI